MANEYLRKIILEEIKKVLREQEDTGTSADEDVAVDKAAKMISDAWWSVERNEHKKTIDREWLKLWITEYGKNSTVALSQKINAIVNFPIVKELVEKNGSMQYSGGLLAIFSELSVYQRQAGNYNQSRSKDPIKGDVVSRKKPDNGYNNDPAKKPIREQYDSADPAQSEFSPIPGGRTNIQSKVGAIANLQRALKKLGANLKVDGKPGADTFAELQTAFPGLGDPETIFDSVSKIDRFTKFVKKMKPEEYAANYKNLKDSYSSSSGTKPGREPILSPSRKIEAPAIPPDLDIKRPDRQINIRAV